MTPLPSEGFMSSFVRRIHFIGIGGVGMSGIAEVLLNLGYKVSGSDAKPTELTKRLAAAGAKIFKGHAASNIKGAEVVVYSSAIKDDNPERAAAKKAGVSLVPRALMLAELARLKKTVTIAGSHGKTTTTSMVAMALRAAGADPTMIIGGQLKNIGSNARMGEGDYFVAEADESDGSFLFLTPLVAVVTNIDDDHMDYYKSMDRLKAAFVQHLHRIPFYGAAVLCADDPVLASLGGRIERPVIRYGLKGGDWRARNLKLGESGSTFDLYHKDRKMAAMRLRVPGRHNVLNALGAVAAGHFLGFSVAQLARGLADFKGVGRRLERLGQAGGIDFIDDYGHHPTEIRATLEAVKKLHCAPSKKHPKGRRLIVIFQPHRYSRTKLLQKAFGSALRGADRVFVAEIYAAGEKPIAGVSSKLIVDSAKRAGIASAPFTRAVDMVRELRPGDVVLSLGAGDVWKIAEDLRRRIADGALGAY